MYKNGNFHSFNLLIISPFITLADKILCAQQLQYILLSTIFILNIKHLHVHISKYTKAKGKQDLKTSNNAYVHHLIAMYIRHNVNDVYSDITVHT